MVRRLYDWTMHWADTPYGMWALAILSFTESIIVPIPPDVLLIALVFAAPKRWWKVALVCTVASIAGGLVGYAVGHFMMESLGQYILNLYHMEDKLEWIRQLYATYGIWFVGIAGFTPVPYKVITLTAGAFDYALLPFIVVSTLSRAARFFLVAGLLRAYGRPIKDWLERYFNLASLAFVLLLLLGFLAIKFIF